MISKNEYTRLKKEARAFRTLAAGFFSLPLRDTVDEVVNDFRRTELYSDAFLSDLDDGLRKSSYAKKYGNKTPSHRRGRKH